jgi:signal transduction histidine kinase
MPGLLIPCLLSGFAMSGVRRLVFTMRELREARETIAHFAATEERLRLARDLHDLLGHSLSPDRRAGLRCQSSASTSSSKIVRCDLRVRALPRIASPPG